MSLLGAVSNTSPENILFAPDKNIKPCSASENRIRPADKRMYDFGHTILVVAIIRTISSHVTGLNSILSPMGVPFMGTSALIGIESGVAYPLFNQFNSIIMTFTQS